MTTWRCKTCGRSTTIEGGKADVDACVAALEARHRRGHLAAARVETSPMPVVRRVPVPTVRPLLGHGASEGDSTL